MHSGKEYTNSIIMNVGIIKCTQYKRFIISAHAPMVNYPVSSNILNENGIQYGSTLLKDCSKLLSILYVVSLQTEHKITILWKFPYCQWLCNFLC